MSARMAAVKKELATSGTVTAMRAPVIAQGNRWHSSGAGTDSRERIVNRSMPFALRSALARSARRQVRTPRTVHWIRGV